jgi:magnesium transporter
LPEAKAVLDPNERTKEKRIMSEADELETKDHILKLKHALADESAISVAELISAIPYGQFAFAISRLGEDEQQKLFEQLEPEQAAGLFEHLNEVQTVGIVEELSPEKAAAIVDELDSEDRVDILKELEPEDSEAILKLMDADEALDARELMRYEEGTAGAVMHSEVLIFQEEQTVEEIVDDLRAQHDEYSQYDVQYAYVVNEDRQLRGVLPVRNLLFANQQKKAKDLMIPEPIRVLTSATLAELEDIFDHHNYLGLPVVNENDQIVGVADEASVSEDREEQSAEDLLKVTGLMGKEEIRSMPLRERSTRRLSWLSINIVLNMISASVIAMHQDTLEAAIALAVFLPIISDMSGCSGNQAVGVSLRELSLGLLRPTEFVRVFLKESQVGIVNGICLGALLGTLAGLWQSNVYLGLVVGTALMLNTLVAVCVGGLVPLLLKWRKQDPALASGPILTTVTDMCGFLLVLSLASLVLDKIA